MSVTLRKLQKWRRFTYLEGIILTLRFLSYTIATKCTILCDSIISKNYVCYVNIKSYLVCECVCVLWKVYFCFYARLFIHLFEINWHNRIMFIAILFTHWPHFEFTYIGRVEFTALGHYPEFHYPKFRFPEWLYLGFFLAFRYPSLFQ